MQHLQSSAGRVKLLTEVVSVVFLFHCKSQPGIGVCRLLVYVTV